jgi:hypothetical protein
VLPVKLGRLRGGWVDPGDSVHGVVIYYGSYLPYWTCDK